MKKNKVFQFLTALSPTELREADEFVRSPIHNKHTQVALLYAYLRKHLHGSDKKLQKEKVFQHLFPGEELDMQKVHHLSSYLLKVLEEYLAWKEWRKKEVDFGLHLMRGYSRLKLEQSFEKTFIKVQKRNRSQPVRDGQYYHFDFLLQEEEYNFVRRSGRTKAFNLQQLSDSQDTAFLIEKLKYACIMLSHQAVSKTTYDSAFLEIILRFLEGNKLLENPALAIYYHAYHALSEMTNEQAFTQLKSLLLLKKEMFDIGEMRDLHILAINYCIRRLNTGAKEYLKEVFDIYQSGLESDVFIDNGELSPWTYSNIVQSGLMLGEFSKVEKVILKYKDVLPEKEREGYFNYNYAWFFYRKKNFQKAMVLLAKTESSKDVLINCTGKTLLARMYFEQDEMESLHSLLQSFKVFIKRKKMLAYHRAPYLEFIKFLHKLSGEKRLSSEDKKELSKEISETKVAAKEWLLEQLHN